MKLPTLVLVVSCAMGMITADRAGGGPGHPPASVWQGQAAPGLAPRLFLPGLVSTAAHEFVVRFTPALDECYLMRSGLDYYTGIVRYRFAGGQWREAGLAPIPFRGRVSYPFISPDGKRLVFDGIETDGLPHLWTAERQGEGWGKAVSLGPTVNSAAVEMHASMSANGNLDFSSNRPGGLGGFDLYRAVKSGDGYAPAENLGPAINSSEFDSHPFVAPDESYLLFDSRRAGGHGSNDLYVSFRQPDGTWTTARNLGPEINTAAGDMRPYVPPGGRVLFFCSDRSMGDPGKPPTDLESFRKRINGPGNGGQDIWWVSLEVVERLRAQPPAGPVSS